MHQDNFGDQMFDNQYDRRKRKGKKSRTAGSVVVPGKPAIALPGAGQKALQGYRGSADKAWVQDMLKRMADSRQLAIASTPYTEIVVTNAAATFHAYASLRELMTACYAAVQGISNKSFDSGALSADIFNMTAGTAASGIATFGWRLRFTASALNFAYRPIQVQIGPILNTAGVLSMPAPVLVFQFIPRRLPVDIFVISPANAAGLATIVKGSQDDVIATTTTSAFNGVRIVSLADANTFAVIETLNARDLIARPTQFAQSAADADYMYDDNGEDGTQVFEGIRDEDEDNFG